jgi:hypothetical protein
LENKHYPTELLEEESSMWLAPMPYTGDLRGIIVNIIIIIIMMNLQLSKDNFKEKEKKIGNGSQMVA